MTDMPLQENPNISETSAKDDSGAPLRNEKGQLLPGQVLNPEGENGRLAGWQPYSKRLQRYLTFPMDELEALIASKEFKQHTAIDRAAILQAKRIGDETHAEHIPERERGNDRIEGKSRQTLALGGDPDNNTPIQWDGTFTLKFPDAKSQPDH